MPEQSIDCAGAPMLNRTQLNRTHFNPIPALGFSLIELLITLVLSSLVLWPFMAWSLRYYQDLQYYKATLIAENEHQHWLHWLWRELQEHASEDILEQTTSCIRFKGFGVRVQNSNLQWQPEQGQCHSAGWQALSDPQRIEWTAFTWAVAPDAEVCLTARLPNLVRQSAPRHPTQQEQTACLSLLP